MATTRATVLATVLCLTAATPAMAEGVYAWCSRQSWNSGENPGVVYVSPVKHFVPDAVAAKFVFKDAVNKKFGTKLDKSSFNCESSEIESDAQKRRLVDLDLIRKGKPKKIEVVEF